MSAKEKYTNVFGKIHSLSDQIPWTTGVFNMVEHLVWDTKSVLGISKAEFWKTIVSYTDKDEYRAKTDAERIKFIKDELENLQSKTDAGERYAEPKSGYCSAREALRRNKYFSEDYLNKEFDIFLNLCSDSYLDYLYSRFIHLKKGGSWSTHGNGGLYSYSVDIGEMQMDNLAYNQKGGVLVANELKLGGKKNKDQILKYCFMFKKLGKKFIDPKDRFLLLFIGGKKEMFILADEVNNEIAYCRTKKHLGYLLEYEEMAKSLAVKSMTWGDLIGINEKYIEGLNEHQQQVEMKLLRGFNTSLKEKAFTERAFINYSL